VPKSAKPDAPRKSPEAIARQVVADREVMDSIARHDQQQGRGLIDPAEPDDGDGEDFGGEDWGYEDDG
jgi:hypothetical protein